VKTERGDLSGFYANVRDAIEKKTPRSKLRTWRCARCERSCWRTRAAERRTVSGARQPSNSEWACQRELRSLKKRSMPSSNCSHQVSGLRHFGATAPTTVIMPDKTALQLCEDRLCPAHRILMSDLAMATLQPSKASLLLRVELEFAPIDISASDVTIVPSNLAQKYCSRAGIRM